VSRRDGRPDRRGRAPATPDEAPADNRRPDAAPVVGHEVVGDAGHLEGMAMGCERVGNDQLGAGVEVVTMDLPYDLGVTQRRATIPGAIQLRDSPAFTLGSGRTVDDHQLPGPETVHQSIHRIHDPFDSRRRRTQTEAASTESRVIGRSCGCLDCAGHVGGGEPGGGVDELVTGPLGRRDTPGRFRAPGLQRQSTRSRTYRSTWPHGDQRFAFDLVLRCLVWLRISRRRPEIRLTYHR